VGNHLGGEGDMSGQMPKPVGSIALVATLLVWSVGVAAPTIPARADDCLAEPNSPAPAGTHWYYHMDSAKQRKCWYIRAMDQSAQPAAAQADPASLSHTPPIPLDKPATASASGPMSISPGDSAPPLPRIKVLAVRPQRPPVSSMATDQPVQQSAQKGPSQASSASSIPEASAPPANASAATPLWPDPPLATVKTQEPAAPSSDTRPEFTRPIADNPVSDDAKSTARGGALTTNSWDFDPAAVTPAEMFPIVALGLIVAGFLLRVVMKITAARRQRITIHRRDFDRIENRLEHKLREDQVIHRRDGLTEYLERSTIPVATGSSPRRQSPVGDEWPDIARARDSASRITDKISMREHRWIDVDPRESEWLDERPEHRWSDDQQQHESVSVDPHEPDWIDDRHQHEGRNDEQQHGSVREADELLDDFQSSLIVAAGDHRLRSSSLQADDQWSNNGRGKDGASQTSDEIREREEVLERLRRDLDRLLRSPKVA
jgi:hypothetical protein